MSLFAKLSQSNKTTGPSPSVSPTVVLPTGGAWVATLARHETGPHHVQVIGPCPISPQLLKKGCVCSAYASGKTFVINISQDCLVISPSMTAPIVSLSIKLWDLLQLPRDAKEVIVDDLTMGNTPKEQNSIIVSHALTDLVISIKDRYVSKRELWMFQIKLLGCVVYRSLAPPYESLLDCSSVVVEDISTASNPHLIMGTVGPQTKIVIRSSSAQICLMFNVSTEMWTFDPVSHEPVFKKAVQMLIDGLDKCIKESKHHYLMLIVTGRVDSLDIYELIYEGPNDLIDVKQTELEFFRFFNNYPSRVNWSDCPFFTADLISSHESPSWFLPSNQTIDPAVNLVRDSTVCSCVHEDAVLNPNSIISDAKSTNLLESINLGISHFSKHHMDRKLRVTGTQITVITANNSILHVADLTLFEVAKRRIQATACGIRIVSVGLRPTLETTPPVCVVKNDRYKMDWLTYYFFTGQSITLFDPDAVKSAPVEALVKRLFQRDMYTLTPSIQVTRPSHVALDLEPKSRALPDMYKRAFPRKPRRSDGEIIQYSMSMPRLQRVAIEASIRPGDVKAIDNWIVQGEGVRTLHDLIGTRLSLDMQLVDISGTEPGTPPILEVNVPNKSVSSGAPMSPRSEKAGTSSIISANAFGVKVHRASMRESHIQKVLLREDRCMWMLNRLDSGNVYVSRVALTGSAAQQTKEDSDSLSYTYQYVIRRSGSAHIPAKAIRKDIIVCKWCQSISSVSWIQRRSFFIPPPLPWNVLDEIISNPYSQQTLPSSIPLNQSPIPPELEGFRWKLRSSIRTALFCLIPADEGFCHSWTWSAGYMLGSELPIQSPISASSITSRFLDWLRKTENLLCLKSLNISVMGDKQRRTGWTGFVPNLIINKNDWLKFHSEQFFQVPRLFMFSLEWILCHAAHIDALIEALGRFAKEDNFRLIRLPHSQLFPCPSLDGFEDAMPFHPATSIRLPEWTKPSFYSLAVNRLTDQLGFLLLLSTKEETCSEGLIGRRTVYSRRPGWILVSKDGSVLVELRSDTVEWIVNSTGLWNEGVSHYTDDVTFWTFKQIVHTSLIDSNQ